MSIRTLACTSIVALACVAAASAAMSTAEQKRLSEGAVVVRELRGTPDKGVPENLWDKAECVIVVPSMKKAAFVFGGEYGRGEMSCRTANGWSAPLFMQLAKGSWGLQIGAEQVDLILLVMNPRGRDKLLQDKVSLGADASVAAGPVGRSGTAATDAQMSAEMLAYSRAQGVFAGIDLSGGVLRPDNDPNKDVYGTADPKAIAGGHVKTPHEARDFMASLGAPGPRATSGR